MQAVSKRETDSELSELRGKIGHYTLYAFGKDNAKRIYELATPFFLSHPTNPEFAFWCLDSLAELISRAYHLLGDTERSTPHTSEEAAELTEDDFRYLMLGLNPLDRKIKNVSPKRAC